jgi:hypothetical protein
MQNGKTDKLRIQNGKDKGFRLCKFRVQNSKGKEF